MVNIWIVLKLCDVIYVPKPTQQKCDILFTVGEYIQMENNATNQEFMIFHEY